VRNPAFLSRRPIACNGEAGLFQSAAAGDKLKVFNQTQ
jgi:hypothetical protein